MDALEKANREYDVAQDKMSLLPGYYAWMYSTFQAHVKGRVLELGAGAGHLIPHYAGQVSEVVAVDNNPALVSRIARDFGHSNISAVMGDLREEFDPVHRGAFDTVIALDIVEHFEDDRALVARMAGALAPQGKLIVKVPADQRLYGAIDQASGHFRRYDREELDSLLRGAGLERVQIGEVNKLGYQAYKRRKNRPSNFSRTFSPATLKLINRAMPLVRLADRVLPTRGLSLVCVYQKV